MDYKKLQCLVGSYLNGFRIVKVENDPFIKGQINLFTDTPEDIGFGDKMFIKFYIRDEMSGAAIYNEQVNKSEHAVTELEKWLRHEIKHSFNNRYKTLIEVFEKLQEFMEI